MKFLRQATPFTQLVYTMVLILTGGLFFSLIGFLACRIFWGIGFDALSATLSNLNEQKNVNLLKFFQILQTFGMFIFPPIVLAWSLDNHPFEYLKLTRKPAATTLFLLFVLILIGGPLIEWLSLVNRQLEFPAWMSAVESWMRNSEDQANEITKAFLAGKSVGGLAGNLFIVAVLPAIGEEMLFRGVIQNLLKKMTGNGHAAIWVTAIIFSALHMQFFGFLPRLLLGVFLGYLFEWSGSLWLSVFAHFVNNGAGVVIYFFTGRGLETEQPDAAVFGYPLFYQAILSAFLVWLLLRYIYKGRSDHSKPVSDYRT